MRLFDPNFKAHKTAFILQSLLVAGFILIVLFAMGQAGEDTIIGAVGISSLSASAFSTFVTSHRRITARKLIGGYGFGILIGGLGRLLFGYLLNDPSIPVHYDPIVAGGLALTLITFIMITTDTEHPPCAGLTVGLTLEAWDPHTLIVIFCAALGLATLRRLLVNRLVALSD